MVTNSCRSLNLVLGVLATLGIVLVTSGGLAQGPPKVAAPPEFAEAEAVLKSLGEVGGEADSNRSRRKASEGSASQCGPLAWKASLRASHPGADPKHRTH